MTGPGPGLVGGEHRGHGQPHLVTGVVLARRIERGGDLGGPCDGCRRARSGRGHGQAAGAHRLAAVLDSPPEVQVAGVADVVQVVHGDPPRRRVDVDPDRFDDLLVLDQARRRRAVREEQPVGDEIAVVDLLAEVAAVGVERVGVLLPGEPGDPVVDPLPDEATGQARMCLDDLLVLGQPTGAGAHGVSVLAQHGRQGAAVCVVGRISRRCLLAASHGGQLVHSDVHAGVQVDVRAAREVALVVDQAAVVALPDPRGRGGQVGSGAGLVAQRPDDDRGVVLVALHQPRGPVQVGLAPRGVVAGVAPPAAGFEAVRLEVALAEHPQAVLVAQVQETVVGWVVGGAHRVDVVLLHEQHVGHHGVLGQGPPRQRMPFVAVDAP